jgi:signal transduction histidine kinase
MLAFTILIFTVISLYFHQSVMTAAKRHMRDEIQSEFIDQFHRTGLDTFKSQWSEYHFEILNMNGAIVVSSPNASPFYPDLNKALMKRALSNGEVFETLTIRDEPYMISYFPLSDKYVGRIASSLATELRHEQNFRKLILITLPGTLLFSFFVSRYMVKQAMKPISDVFTFQENFSSSVSHELRSPLASLKGNFEVSLRKERSLNEYRETLRSGLTEVDRIINLLNDLYLLASARFKSLDLFRQQVNIKPLMLELVDGYLPRLNAKGIKLVHSMNSNVFCICDEGLMRRVFDNVLNNAVKYTPGGGSITIRAYEVLGKMLVNVSNTCKGITTAEVKYFFEPFYRGKMIIKENFEGKGLGLFIARYIVRSHGGEISAKITDDKRFSLTISLPIK